MSSQEIGSYKSLKLIKSKKVNELIEQRYLTDEDLQIVIHHAETTGYKLYQEGSNRFLTRSAKYLPVIYAEYTPTDDGFEIHSAYGHRSKII